MTKINASAVAVDNAVRKAWRTVFPGSAAHDQEDFYELGGDSHIALRFVFLVADELNMDIQVDILLDVSSVGAIIKLLRDEATDEMLELFSGAISSWQPECVNQNFPCRLAGHVSKLPCKAAGIGQHNYSSRSTVIRCWILPQDPTTMAGLQFGLIHFSRSPAPRNLLSRWPYCKSANRRTSISSGASLTLCRR